LISGQTTSEKRYVLPLNFLLIDPMNSVRGAAIPVAPSVYGAMALLKKAMLGAVFASAMTSAAHAAAVGNCGVFDGKYGAVTTTALCG
jgi:hypothetical protein